MRTNLATRAAGAALGVLSLLGVSACAVSTPEAVADPTTGCMISAPAGFDD
ncbi:BMP family ABC transporter substrate-binding protein, partial [Burkholderia multivorans]